MKRHKVIVTPEAQAGIQNSFHFIHEDSPRNAAHWLIDLYSKIETPERFPERCSYAREYEFVDEETRQLIFGSHRIVFSVDSTTATVYVLQVRHAKMRAVGEPQVESESLNMINCYVAVNRPSRNIEKKSWDAAGLQCSDGVFTASIAFAISALPGLPAPAIGARQHGLMMYELPKTSACFIPMRVAP